MKKIVVGITGASGSIYAKRLVEVLTELNVQVRVVITNNGKKVFNFELGEDFDRWVTELSSRTSNIVLEDNSNLFSGIASGSNSYDAVIILPCSMGTLAEISCGISKNLICRAADVAIKEGRPLIIVPRETPLSAIHLENMLKLAKLGVSIIPAMPGFYHHPHTLEEIVDFLVGKILDHLHIENDLFTKWEGQKNEVK